LMFDSVSASWLNTFPFRESTVAGAWTNMCTIVHY
jgi:hypothetical protein